LDYELVTTIKYNTTYIFVKLKNKGISKIVLWKVTNFQKWELIWLLPIKVDFLVDFFNMNMILVVENSYIILNMYVLYNKLYFVKYIKSRKYVSIKYMLFFKLINCFINSSIFNNWINEQIVCFLSNWIKYIIFLNLKSIFFYHMM